MELPIAAFVAGLLGGVHCVGMCGGIAGALGGGTSRIRGEGVRETARTIRVPIVDARNAMSSWQRLLAFNLGRIGSYAIAGGVAGAFGSAVTLGGAIESGRTAAFIAAQTMLVLLGLYVAGWSTVFPRFEAAGTGLWRRIEPLRRRCLPVDSLPKAVAAGAVWGWVPCGLVYGMLPFALAGAGVANGALTLVAFGIGTLPWLLAAGALGARFAQVRRNAIVRQGAGLLLIVLAAASLMQLLHGHLQPLHAH
jgi:sulfite exporter TauE/SafE